MLVKGNYMIGLNKEFFYSSSDGGEEVDGVDFGEF